MFGASDARIERMVSAKRAKEQSRFRPAVSGTRRDAEAALGGCQSPLYSPGFLVGLVVVPRFHWFGVWYFQATFADLV
jgi:hypothetical protein